MKKFMAYIHGFIKYRHLLAELVIRDIKVRYRRSVLGLFWTILNPLLMMTIMTIIFSTLFKMNIENFPVYFFCGNLLFTFNSEATTQAQMSILANGSLIKKVYIPKYLFPFSRVVSSLVNMGFAFIALIIVMLATGAPFHWTMLLTPILLLYLVMFTTGLSLILSALTVFFRDLAHLYSVFILAWMYFTPLFYPIEILPDSVKFAMNFNPMYHFVRYFRDIIMNGTVPGAILNLSCLAVGLIMLIIGLLVFYKRQDKFILYI